MKQYRTDTNEDIKDLLPMFCKPHTGASSVIGTWSLSS